MEHKPETIACCHACGSTMDISVAPPFSNVECPACGEHTRVKREFGPYTLTRRLAVGGMSMVYVARDNTLDREVALKILSETYSADEKRIAAFEEEARLTASLSHPDIVRVYTTGKAFGRFYIAMELVPGGHFEHQIHERGSIPEDELLPIAIEVAEGLKAAHSAGLIHRDVKPGNILLDAEGHAKLVDFGLALVTQSGSAKATELWATPYYVPPETIEGAPEDFRSDIYSFGATLYHALTGKPSCAEETMATNLLRAAKKKIAPLASLDHSSTEEIRRIIDKAMAYHPADRYQNYDALLSDLRAAHSHLRSGDSGHSAARRGREKLIVIASITVVAFAAATIVFRKKPAPPPVAVSPPQIEIAPIVPDEASETARLYPEAREAVGRRDYATAAEKFRHLFQSDRTGEPTRSWAGVESILAVYLDGKPSSARQAAHDISRHLHEHEPGSGPGREIALLLDQLDDFRPLEAPDKSEGAPAVVGSLLAGLKNWEQGLIRQASACFEKTASVQLPSHSKWASVYQEIARDYLHDAKLLSSSVFDSLPIDVAGCDKALGQLEELSSKWKTNGRAKFNARAWEIDIRRHRTLLAVAPAPSGESSSPAAPVDPVPQGRALIGDFRFSEAAEALRSTSSPEAKSLFLLAESSAAFLADLEKDLPSPSTLAPLLLLSGEMVTKLSLVSPGKLLATLTDGTTRECGWKDLDPSSLIDLHRALVANAAETEKTTRHERAISFDWLVGNRARANEVARKLSDVNSDFKARWETIIHPLDR